MNSYKNPPKSQWSDLTSRPTIQQEQLNENVLSIMQDVQRNGDDAIIKYTHILDGFQLSKIAVSQEEFTQANAQISEALKASIKLAKNNITAFHKAQEQCVQVIETTAGVQCWRKSVAIQKVGLYIPGGSAPLFSTILMLGIPAQLAACKEVVLCTPCNNEGRINPAILYTAQLVGIKTIYKVGGAQAIAAMTFGTDSVLKVDKIFGPGNQYVTQAKALAQQFGVAIDMPAGPSEVLVIADKSANPAFVAADLLSQAEHGSDSQVILLSNDANIIKNTLAEVDQQLSDLPRNTIAKQALINSKAIFFDTFNKCIDFSNSYAPEHLILAINNANDYLDNILNAGSVFIGKYSCESAGDYASGTNHTLPTNAYAKSYSGVSLDSFVKKISFQKISAKGLQNIGNAIEIMAEAEDLFAHKNAVSIRLKAIADV